MSNPKSYTHIDGLRGNGGEDPATMAVAAILDPSPNYPADARIVAGSSRRSESDIGGFACGPIGAVKVAAVLLDAAVDVEEMLGRDAFLLREARHRLKEWLITK